RSGSTDGACAPTVSCEYEPPRYHLPVGPGVPADLGLDWPAQPALRLTPLLLFLLPLLGPFLGTFAMPGVPLGLQLGSARHESAHLAHAHHHLDPLHHAHLGNLPHQASDLIELDQELLDLVRLGAGAGRDPPPPAQVDDVGILALLL